MALAGIGVDMLEISRMERVVRRRPSFLRRVFTDDERAYCERCARPAEHYAARFAAREAVLKALGCGFADTIENFQNRSLEECRELGVNDSMIHEDFMIGCDSMDIDAICENGQVMPVFRAGNWAF